MFKIIIFFIALAIAIYLFDRPIIPEPIERNPSSLLAEQIEKCHHCQIALPPKMPSKIHQSRRRV